MGSLLGLLPPEGHSSKQELNLHYGALRCAV